MCMGDLQYSWLGSSPWALLACHCWRWGFSDGELAGVPGLHLWGKTKKHVRGNGGCVLISIRGITNGTYA